MLSFRIALRYLFSRKSWRAVNIISYISMGGVALATAAIVIVLSVFNGFRDFTERQLSPVTPDLVIEPAEGKTIAAADSLAETLSRRDEIVQAQSVIQEKALAVCGDRQIAVTLRGEQPDSLGMIASMRRFIIDGEAYVGDAYGLPLGLFSVGVANSLSPMFSGDQWVRLYEPRRKGRINPSNPMAAFTADSVLPSGVFRIDSPDYDTDRLIVPLETARRLLDYDDEAGFIEIHTAPGVDLNRLKAELEQSLGPEFTVKTRQQLQQDAFRMINIEKWITLLMLTFILIIASFNILSTLSMIVAEKRDNMSILKALGASPDITGKIFSRLSFLISAIGGAVGILLGLALSLAQQWGGFIKLGASQPAAMAIDTYPVRVNLPDLALVVAIIIVVGALTAAIFRRSLSSTT